jgi:hypothetical protein
MKSTLNWEYQVVQLPKIRDAKTIGARSSPWSRRSQTKRHRFLCGAGLRSARPRQRSLNECSPIEIRNWFCVDRRDRFYPVHPGVLP